MIAYLALYLGAGWVGGQLFGDLLRSSMFSTAGSVFAALTWPLVVGAVVLTAFPLSVGWFRPLLARQPIGGRWWMWVAPTLIVITLGMRYVGIDYSVYPGSAIFMTLVTGLFIGFVEEVLTRGIVVKMLRDGGTSEWVVMLDSALAFALMHSINVLSGMSPLVVAALLLIPAVIISDRLAGRRTAQEVVAPG